ncbi:glycosyltransferase family 4 protein [Elusimicrobiota bacterium]
MKKKRFLWLLPYFPYPPVSGGNVRVFNLIKYLSCYYDIHLLSYIDHDIPDEYIKELEKYCKCVTVVERKLYEGELPLIFRYYYTPEMIKELKNTLKDNFNFIQIDFLTMGYYVKILKELTSTPVFFTEHDVSSFDFEKCFHNRHLPDKERYIEWTKMHEVIKEIYPLFDVILTVSNNDAEILKNKFPDYSIYAAPTGTDCEYYAYKARNSAGKGIIYVGHYIHYPNVDSVHFFLEDIFPLIEEKYPEMKFYIVGSGGREKFKDLENSKVEITGTIPDIRDYLYMEGIFAAPIRIGIGIRGKILEAMSAGMPVVSSALGAEGIGANNEEQLLIADTPAEFSGQIQRLIEDKALRDKLTGNAEKFVRRIYNWPVIIEKLGNTYEQYLNGQ